MAVSRETLAEIHHAIGESKAVALGIVPLGLAFGLFMTQSGYAWWWTPIFSFVIYAGSMEFLAVSLVVSAMNPFTAALTGFMVNFRHAFYGLTFPRHRIPGAFARAYSTYALTDESYAIVSARPRLSGPAVLAVQIFCQVLWAVPGVVGALAGLALPPGLEGMDFALTALFIVLAWETFDMNRDWSLPILAAAFGVAALLVVPNQMLIVALCAYFVLLITRYRFPEWDRALTVKREGDR